MWRVVSRASNPHSLSVIQIMHVGWGELECQASEEEASLGIRAGSSFGTDAGFMKVAGMS